MFSGGSDSVTVEFFELSPRNESVIRTGGRLRRIFPGRAVQIPLSTFADPAFLESVTFTLAKMSQSVAFTHPKTRKANHDHDETRDTKHPRIVTELFFGLFLSIGRATEVSSIWKNTREEVMYRNADKPWHRSSFWLLLRVSMQLTSARISSHDGSSHYKSFMVFFMAYLLRRIGQWISSDLLHTMQAKISRRLLKLDLSNAHSWLQDVKDSMCKASDVVQARWRNINAQDGNQEDISSLATVNFGENIGCNLPELDTYLESISTRTGTHRVADFKPSRLDRFEPSQLPKISSTATSGDTIIHELYTVETWVAENLDAWTQDHLQQTNTCQHLYSLILSYHKFAFVHYARNPEALSVMFLTILELWIACDKSALTIFPMLTDYDIGMPDNIFELILLVPKSQMQRLHAAETYLSSRRCKTQYEFSIFSIAYGNSDSFAVRYFEQSTQLQQLRNRIETEAHEKRQQKREELSKKKEEYWRLMKLHDEGKCEYKEIFDMEGRPSSFHSASCKRCGYKTQANSMDIEVHEWPLPESDPLAMATVFELQVPSTFAFWRQTTNFILFDVFYGKYANYRRIDPGLLHSLQDYINLREYFVGHSDFNRISVFSDAKPHTNTHYRSKYIGDVMEEDILVKNGMRYKYYDGIKQTFLGPFDFGSEMTELCTLKLPKESLSLRRFLFRPPPNHAISSQNECPSHITTDEYKSLASMPLGYRLQWQNIIRQLAMPSVDFRKRETALMIYQIIHQCGPAAANNMLRTGHLQVEDENFAHTLLSQLKTAVNRVRGNWESYHGVWLFIALATKVLSLSSSETVHQTCLDILDHLRSISFEWVMYLRRRAENSTADEQKATMNDTAYLVALVFAVSFDCDEEHLHHLLAEQTNVTRFLQCAMFIRERETRDTLNDSDIFRILLQFRWRRFCQRALPLLRENIVSQRQSSLHDAIKNHWPGYQPGLPWTIAGPSDHWLQSQSSDNCVFQFNLLTGELLWNGLPANGLPTKIRSHNTYRELFGRASMEVMPSPVVGMQFTGKNIYAGHIVHLGLESKHRWSYQDADLLVQISSESGTFELIPRRVIEDKFPIFYTKEFVHWYNIEQNYIIFCPVQTPWVFMLDAWKLRRNGGTWILANGSCSLLNVHSEASHVISKIMSPIEDSRYIHCLVSHASSTLEIDLPSLNLQFYTDSEQQAIHARQYPGVAIDNDQRLGTLVGLRSKIILADKQKNRVVIITEGNLTWSAFQGHIAVQVAKRTVVRVHSYSVDSQLCRLVDNGSLQSKLFLCYLHALTSFCLPDTLTMRTGTEQALSILQSAAVKSFDRLTEENVGLLAQIATMTPSGSTTLGTYAKCKWLHGRRR